jgi:hypothetical protein
VDTRTRNLELVEPQPVDEEAATGGAGLLEDSRLSTADAEAARELAESHREIAARLAPGSRLRGLMLRAGGHWSRLAGLPKSFLNRA